MALIITKHAALRMAQRGIRVRDAELIALIGTEVDNGFLVLSRDVHEWVHALKRLINRITRLEGKLLITAQQMVVKTAFHTSRQQQRKRLRGAYESDHGRSCSRHHYR